MNEQPVTPVLEPASSADTEPVAGAAHGAIPDLVHAETLYQSGKYAAASGLLSASLALPVSTPEQLRGLDLLTRALARQGLLDQALATSERWLAADQEDARAHYLHAMLLQERGDRGQAQAALQRAVYLQPEFPLAHFALGNHARAEARSAEARRHFAEAAQLLRGLPKDEPVPEAEGLTAGRLREILSALGSDS